MAREPEHDDKRGDIASRQTERIYLSPEIVRQRQRTLEILAPAKGEHILDIGCGPGLLAHDLALEVGPGGRVTGVDKDPAMLDLARRRCAELPQVDLLEGEATDLPATNSTLDAVTCAQVLLYVEDVERAIATMHRVLKPGGRAVIVETDWRSLVLSSAAPELTETMITAWDRAVASPNLPVRLGPLLRARGFAAVRVEAFPVLSTHCRTGGYAAGMAEHLARTARENGSVTTEQSARWLKDLERLDAEGAYFFCVNRFIFSTVKA